MTRQPRPIRRVDRRPPRGRGPQVPHDVMAFLIAAWERHQDTAIDLSWRDALRRAWRALQRQARRGVQAALASTGIGQFVPHVPPPPVREREEWELDITASAAATGARGIANGVMEAFVHMIRWFARGVGAHMYYWTSTNDDRVRPLHRQLDGTLQHWDSPPVSGSHGWRGHPGEPAGCRCIPRPTL